MELILKGFDKSAIPSPKMILLRADETPFADKQPEWDNDTDPHLVAGVLKSWLCELEAPLLTWELHDAFIAAQGTFSSRLFPLPPMPGEITSFAAKADS